MNAKSIYELVRDAGMKWWDDRAMRMGAALAFYTALSLSPILLIVIAISGFVFGREAASGAVFEQISEIIGSEAAQAVQATLASAWSPTQNIVATIVGFGTLLFAATGVFAELQDDLNIIWDVQPKPGNGIMAFLRDRLLSLSIILALGFLLLVSLVISAALSAAATYLTHLFPEAWAIALQILNVIVMFGVSFLLFALIFRFLPDIRIRWADVLIGAAITAALFMIGKYLIGLYLGTSAIGSSYGAAGSFVVLLMWLYYSTLILLFGAELTQVYAQRYGHGMAPSANAEIAHRDASGPGDGQKVPATPVASAAPAAPHA